MKHLEELSTMTFYKERLFLPHGAKKQKGTILFSLNTSYESLVDRIFNDSDLPLTNTGGIYKSYYYDYTLLPNAINSPRVVTKPTTLATAMDCFPSVGIRRITCKSKPFLLIF